MIDYTALRAYLSNPPPVRHPAPGMEERRVPPSDEVTETDFQLVSAAVAALGSERQALIEHPTRITAVFAFADTLFSKWEWLTRHGRTSLGQQVGISAREYWAARGYQAADCAHATTEARYVSECKYNRDHILYRWPPPPPVDPDAVDAGLNRDVIAAREITHRWSWRDLDGTRHWHKDTPLPEPRELVYLPLP